MRHAIILTGINRYADPWHPFRETSSELARIASEAGFDPEVITDVDGTLAELATAAIPDLVIANIGRPGDPQDADLAAAATVGLDRVLREAPVLAMHAAANAFPDVSAWEAAIGGRWIPGISGHPPFAPTTLTRQADLLGVTDGVASFEVEDERYLGLRQGSDRTVLYTHPDEDGGAAPSIWVRDPEGGPRCAYDALGHDTRSYASAGHARVLAGLMSWLVHDDAP